MLDVCALLRGGFTKKSLDCLNAVSAAAALNSAEQCTHLCTEADLCSEADEG